MSEFFKSFTEWMQKRATTSIIGTYAVFWAAYHWQVIYTTMFVSENKVYEKFHLLKNEYISTYFLGFHWDRLETYLAYLVPALLTFVFIWVLPTYLFIPSFKVERKYKLDRRRIVIKGDIEMEKERAKLVEENTKVLVAEKEAAVIEKEIEEIDPNKLNDAEYEKFMEATDASDTLDHIKTILYGMYNGRLSSYTSGTRTVRPPEDPDAIAKAHANGLIEITTDPTQTTIRLTEKGKYFLKKYI